jgi:hypothetical protein
MEAIGKRYDIYDTGRIIDPIGVRHDGYRHPALRALVPHLRDFELDEDNIVRRQSLLIWGHTSIPLRRRHRAR